MIRYGRIPPVRRYIIQFNVIANGYMNMKACKGCSSPHYTVHTVCVCVCSMRLCEAALPSLPSVMKTLTVIIVSSSAERFSSSRPQQLTIHTHEMAAEWFVPFAEFASAYPVSVAALVGLSLLTSPFGVARLLAICVFTIPYYTAQALLAYCFPWFFEKKVAGEVCYITGGASGIGKLMSERFISLGATVVVLDVNEAMLKQAHKEIQAHAAGGGHCFAFVVDLADRAATYAAMEKAKEAAGPCTILVNNAGIVTGKTLLAGSDRLQELTMAVNTTAHFWTVKAALPGMIERNHGHICTIASSAGLCGIPGLADYCASKAGALYFDEAIRLEMRKNGHTGVKTTVVCPFYIKTGMFEGCTTKWPRLLPLLEPEYVANAIVSASRRERPMLCMPVLVNLVPMLRGLLPIGTCEFLGEWFGVLDSMDDFKGRMASSKKAD
jgi:all-trans-retinol dehydrogenase (NAD+)